MQTIDGKTYLDGPETRERLGITKQRLKQLLDLGAFPNAEFVVKKEGTRANTDVWGNPKGYWRIPESDVMAHQARVIHHGVIGSGGRKQMYPVRYWTEYRNQGVKWQPKLVYE